MDQKQKERLRFLLKARKRAEKVLAAQRDAKRKKVEHENRLRVSLELKEQYTQELTAIAQESGVLSLAEQAAIQRGGSLAEELSCYIDYGLASNLRHAAGVVDQGVLKASHLAIRITWEDAGASNEVEVQVHHSGSITFHHSLLPVFPLIWRWKPRLLQMMFANALKHPRRPPAPSKQE